MSRAKALPSSAIAHGVAAVFHHDDLAVVAQHVGQRRRDQPGAGDRPRSVSWSVVWLIGDHPSAEGRLYSGFATAEQTGAVRVRPVDDADAAISARSSSMPAPVADEVASTRDGRRGAWRSSAAVVADDRRRVGRPSACRPWSARSGRRPPPCRGWSSVSLVVGLEPVAGVDQHIDAAQGRPAAQIVEDRARPGRDLLLRRPA